MTHLTVDKPELKNAVDEIRHDVATFIQKLSEKLLATENKISESQVKDNKNNNKQALLRAEAGRMEQLREEQTRIKKEKNYRNSISGRGNQNETEETDEDRIDNL